MAKASSEIEEKLALLRQHYASQIPDKVAELENARDRAVDGDAETRAEAVRELRHLTHKLAGSGATFGLTEISTEARAVEQRYQALIDDGDAARMAEGFDALSGDLAKLLATMRAVVSEAPPAGSPDLEGDDGGEENDGADGDARRVLVLEPDPVLAETFETELGNFGYEVTPVSDGPALAAELDGQDGSAIVICEIALGGDPVGGITAAEAALEGREPRSPLVFLGADESLETRLRAVRAGCDAFLPRPPDFPHLVDVLDRLGTAVESEPFKVLIVDDDPSLTRYTEVILKGAGMETAVVNDPMTVMETLDGFAPELILMDLYMPGCDGQELAAVIRQQESFAGIPIVFLSGEASKERQLGAMGQGGDDFLTKPIEPAHLIASVKVRVARFRQLRSLMVRDSLTGLLNHTTTIQFLEKELARSRRETQPLALAMLDIDHFKKVNDTHGHAAGDRVIKSLARLLKQQLRTTDVIGRMGGEEFAAVITGVDPDEARRIMDRLRAAFSRLVHRTAKTEFSVTLSCGIAGFPAHDNLQALTLAADVALYEAKNGGRNRVVVSPG